MFFSFSIHVTETVPCSTSGPQGVLSKYDHSRKSSSNAEREFLQGAGITDYSEGSDDVMGLSTDSLSRLRSPSVLEVREKGYERLKEELAKAQRVRFNTLQFTSSTEDCSLHHSGSLNFSYENNFCPLQFLQ